MGVTIRTNLAEVGSTKSTHVKAYWRMVASSYLGLLFRACRLVTGVVGAAAARPASARVAAAKSMFVSVV